MTETEFEANELFAGMADAQASRDSNYIRRGHYLLLIDRVKIAAKRSGERFLANEMTVLHTFEDGDGAPSDWHKPGESPSHLIMRDGTGKDMFLPNVKAMIANILGVDPAEVDEKAAADVCGKDQPFAGLVVEVRARVIQTRKGTDFTRVSYVREVPAEEFVDIVDPEILRRYLPDAVAAD